MIVIWIDLTNINLLCIESFLKKKECIILQLLLEKIRYKINNKYRIKTSKLNVNRVINLVKLYMHKDFLYKLEI